MTVAELIKELEKQDQDATVRISSCIEGHECCGVSEYDGDVYID